MLEIIVISPTLLLIFKKLYIKPKVLFAMLLIYSILMKIL